ncbi:chromosome segregation protein SMC [Pseudactinotalea sp. HY158]|uniref:chromosome segregation protein SMC n=1 Tax=Pseudactinotalea sp. HY158 TaxID=2654547 RepID=UPI00129CEECD|nr:chromosome segregation protein SMC [Pseudactinotalea sp. HY158]QGH69916.1 chromosome segregation protein SMC [Pseudactinotalea sp. HY158]
MHLKTLTLRGFKSFASATTLHFEPGITAVVGPNGSGKSNVVDALAWVMGEQGAKTLRGGNMADVIFAGTSSRPPLGRAEVSLTIDNTDGALPIDYTEVTISRTLFQGGGSEYAINGTSCRLLDIAELLSDSGLGREMHVIVGQGRLDAMLSATPEDRRGFIEEAAGVLKHRKRKEKALRKLDGMAANLARVGDLVTEIRRQLGPLAKQADIARRAHVVQADLRDAKARLVADDYVQLTAALEAEQADENALRARREQVEDSQLKARARLTALEGEAAAAAPALNEAAEMWFRLSSLRERLRGTATLAAERGRLLEEDDRAPVTGPDPRDLDAQAARARGTEGELTAEHTAAAAALETAVERRRHAEGVAAEAEKALARVHRDAADRREHLARLTGRVAAARSRLEATEAEVERLRAGHAAARSRAEEAGSAYARLEQEAVGAEAGEEDLDTAHEAALARLTAAEETVTSLTERRRGTGGELATWTARRDALDLSLTRRDATGTLLEGDVPGILGAFADRLQVRAGYENAIAAALGTWADAAVAETIDDAAAALERVRADESGTAHLVIAGDGAPARRPAPVAGEWASDLVTPEPDVAGAVLLLLEGVVVVDDLTEAADVARAGDPGVVAVTRGGDVVTATRASGGAGDSPSVLELHAARDEAASAVTAAERELAGIETALEPAREALQLAQSDADAALAALHDSDAALAAVAERLAQLGSTMRAGHAEAERTAGAIEDANASRSTIAAELAELTATLAAAEGEARDEPAAGAGPAAGVDPATAAAEARDEAAVAATTARGAETDAGSSCAPSRNGSARSGRAAALERSRPPSAAPPGRRRARPGRAAQRVSADLVEAGAERALAAIDTSLAAAQRARDEAEAARTARETELGAVRTQVDALAREHAELTDVVHKDEVARAGQRATIEALATRAADELGLDPEELVESYGPHLLIPATSGPSGTAGAEDDAEAAPVPFVRAEQEKRLRKAERALALLGKVNPLALEEHAALEERHNFLSRQLADIKSSRADLLQIVAEIDERVEQVFADAFADTAVQFERVFARLFPGGEGRLLLTDPGDLLTTGIEVEARPPGKKVKRLSLLSGGERSLTAVAILVAIFKARPSPFYVMDEVEAALDDTNLGRLIDIFRELREDSQLIVITHQKRTMEVADALYGVTMRGDGVTTLISQRLGQGEPA